MILVNNPGNWDCVYWPLLHAEWHGWTPTDLIYPFFLFMVGMSLSFSRRDSYREALTRAAKLIGLGLLLNLYPHFPFAELRWPGVLQRIGICYLAAFAVKRHLASRGQVGLVSAILVGYWLLLSQVTGPEGHPPDFGMETNLAGQVDRILLAPHVWGATETWDPEGVLSTFPAIATTVLGLLAGRWVRSSRGPFPMTVGLLLSGLVLAALGVLWGEAAPAWLAFPINKGLWTSPFVLLTGGLAAAGFGLIYWVVDVVGRGSWARPFATYGKNAIAVYVASGLFADTLWALGWAGQDGVRASVYERLFQVVFASWLPCRDASLAFAVTVVLLFYLMARAMDRRGIYLKV
jgi:predicted acyltransferase